jgi:hypothetical protein
MDRLKPLPCYKSTSSWQVGGGLLARVQGRTRSPAEWVLTAAARAICMQAASRCQTLFCVLRVSSTLSEDPTRGEFPFYWVIRDIYGSGGRLLRLIPVALPYRSSLIEQRTLCRPPSRTSSLLQWQQASQLDSGFLQCGRLFSRHGGTATRCAPSTSTCCGVRSWSTYALVSLVGSS